MVGIKDGYQPIVVLRFACLQPKSGRLGARGASLVAGDAFLCEWDGHAKARLESIFTIRAWILEYASAHHVSLLARSGMTVLVAI